MYKLAKDIVTGETITYDAIDYVVFAVSHNVVPGYCVFCFTNGTMIKEADLADLWVS